MTIKQVDFDRAQNLYKKYFTHSTNKTITENLFDVFNDEVDFSLFDNKQVSPREFLNLFLQKNYPNEISIKSNFINKVIMKTKKHVTIFELNVGSSRVDLCKINGHSTAYEIKTEFDSPTRLASQMKDYFKIFEKVYLICPEKKLYLYEKLLPDNCGIYTYRLSKTGKYFFKLKKNAQESIEINPKLQLFTFSKRELRNQFLCPDFQDKEQMILWVQSKYPNKMINFFFKKNTKEKYQNNWEFLRKNQQNILEIDYQWFFKNQILPHIVYAI